MPKPTPKKTQRYNVDVYNGKNIIAVISVMATDVEDASNKAREEFFQGIHAKVKRAY